MSCPMKFIKLCVNCHQPYDTSENQPLPPTPCSVRFNKKANTIFNTRRQTPHAPKPFKPHKILATTICTHRPARAGFFVHMIHRGSAARTLSVSYQPSLEALYQTPLIHTQYKKIKPPPNSIQQHPKLKPAFP